MSKHITKTDIVRALKCYKQAYLARFKPSLMAPIDPYHQLLIDRGHKVGKIAQAEVSKTHKSKLLFESGNKVEDGLVKTQLALKDSRLQALFEPSFSKKDLLVRCDILLKQKTGYELIEVKSGSDLDDEYILDAAIQTWVLKKAGIKIKKISLWYVNKQCPLPELTNLFIKKDVTNEIQAYFPKIEETVKNLRKLFKSKVKNPNSMIAKFSTKLHQCDIEEPCQSHLLMPEFSVFNIPRISKRSWELLQNGIKTIEQIDLTKMKFTAPQTRMIECTQKKLTYLDVESIKKHLKPWQFPLYLIDFEAMDYDLPGFLNTRPGIHIAFQLSIKKLSSATAAIESVGHYLHDDGSDPRIALGKFMLQHLDNTSGSLVAYSQAFEKGKILDIASLFTGDEKLKLEALPLRLVDPLPVFREAVYHPDFKGSFSIKKVGPALLGSGASYESLPIKDGTEAVVNFRKMINSQNPEEKKELFQNLVQYCDQDTEVMGLLVQWLYKQI